MIKENKCIICNNNTEFYFSKQFDLKNLHKADYYKCTNCGFTLSKTHAEMPQQQWNDLNKDFHLEFLGTQIAKIDPNWTQRLSKQNIFINRLIDIGILNKNKKWVDFGCGDGKLADMLLNKKINIKKFDRYCPVGNGFIDEKEFKNTKFDIAINTSVFEHLFLRKDMEEILSIPSECLLFHTLVREEIPNDPNWFYLLSVHCALHTNKNMQILFNEFGYKYSIYNVDARMWAFFKDDEYIKIIHEKIQEENDFNTNIFIKFGFMDYWK